MTEDRSLSLDPMSASDWPAVREIFEQGVATGNATFETQASSWQEWDQTHMERCRIVARNGHNSVAGWAALSDLSDRCAYVGVAEVSIYVALRSRRRGVGRALLEELVTASEEVGIWTLQAGIFPENEASLRLFRETGFRDVGRRERLGALAGVWRDVLQLERRSRRVGVD